MRQRCHIETEKRKRDFKKPNLPGAAAVVAWHPVRATEGDNDWDRLPAARGAVRLMQWTMSLGPDFGAAELAQERYTNFGSSLYFVLVHWYNIG